MIDAYNMDDIKHFLPFILQILDVQYLLLLNSGMLLIV